MATETKTQPFSPLEEIQDLSRRYEAMKDKIEAIAIMAAVQGTPIGTLGITISSRFVLRAVLVSQNGVVGDLKMAPGDAEPRERWGE